MKILIITRGKLPIPNIRGGAVEYLIQMIVDENEKSWHHDLTVLTKYVEGIEEYQNKYRYCKFVNIKTSGFLGKLGTVIRYIINTKIKYVGNYYIAKGLKKLGCLKSYDVVIDENAPDFLPILRKKYSGRLVYHGHNDWNNISFNECDEYWAISEYLASKARAIKATCQVMTVYNGIDLSAFHHVNQNEIVKFKTKYKIEKDDLVLVYSGRIVEEKGVLDLIQAFNKMNFPLNVKLLIVGGTFYSSAKKSKYLEKCLQLAEGHSNIIFTGYIDGDSMPVVYHSADIGCFPSKWQEPFGLSLLEMMACGLPILTTRNGAISEIVTEDCAVTVDSKGKEFVDKMAQAMRYLVDDKVMCSEMGENARNRAKQFDKSQYIDKIKQLL